MAYKLSDDAIALIARQLQVAILTGTDVVDNLRLMELETSGELLVPSDACVKSHDEQINSLMRVLENGLLSHDDGAQVVS